MQSNNQCGSNKEKSINLKNEKDDYLVLALIAKTLSECAMKEFAEGRIESSAEVSVCEDKAKTCLKLLSGSLKPIVGEKRLSRLLDSANSILELNEEEREGVVSWRDYYLATAAKTLDDATVQGYYEVDNYLMCNIRKDDDEWVVNLAVSDDKQKMSILYISTNGLFSGQDSSSEIIGLVSAAAIQQSAKALKSKRLSLISMTYSNHINTIKNPSNYSLLNTVCYSKLVLVAGSSKKYLKDKCTIEDVKHDFNAAVKNIAYTGRDNHLLNEAKHNTETLTNLSEKALQKVRYDSNEPHKNQRGKYADDSSPIQSKISHFIQEITQNVFSINVKKDNKNNSILIEFGFDGDVWGVLFDTDKEGLVFSAIYQNSVNMTQAVNKIVLLSGIVSMANNQLRQLDFELKKTTNAVFAGIN